MVFLLNKLVVAVINYSWIACEYHVSCHRLRLQCLLVVHLRLEEAQCMLHFFFSNFLRSRTRILRA